MVYHKVFFFPTHFVSCNGPCAPKEKWHRKEHIIIIKTCSDDASSFSLGQSSYEHQNYFFQITICFMKTKIRTVYSRQFKIKL